MAYDFTTLSPPDFEDLCRDLIGRELGIRFEAFAPGPDGGMDGRHARGGSTTILQVKHYAGSTFSKLKSEMRKERASIDALAPDRYILATSRQLTPPNKALLAAEIGPALQTEGDIKGAGELNSLLRDYPDTVKAHIKLWLSSTPVLERILHAARHTVTDITKEEIEAKVRVFADNASYPAAQTIIEAQHVLIISGPPGVGKTTLAQMLSYAYLAEDWQLNAIRSLDDGFGTIDDSKQQVFLFDDFLGTIALDEQALAAKDSDLARFMRRVRTSKNARFILTTRAHIFQEARRASEHLADQRLDISRYLLDVEVYTRHVRARMLYNHLDATDAPKSLVRALVERGMVKDIVDHKNYSPRVIEWMTDGDRLIDQTPETYPAAFLAALDNPSGLWDTAYRKHIPQKCQHLLLAMYFCSQYGVELDELRTAFEALHHGLCAKYGVPWNPKDFEEAVRILEGGFIKLQGKSASYVNPSFRDYMSRYVNDIGLLCDCAGASQSAGWAENVWGVVRGRAYPPDQRKRLALALLPIAERFLELPTWVETQRNSYQIADLGNARRLDLLLEWWGASGDARFATLALQLSRNPPAPPYWVGYSSWREGSDLVELVRQLRDGDYYPELPVADELIANLERDLVRMLNGGVAADELEGLVNAIYDAQPPASEKLRDAATAAIHREIDDVDSTIADFDSESALDDHAKSLGKLASRAGVPAENLARALSRIEDRAFEISERTSVKSSPSIRPPAGDGDGFDDAALDSLFAQLLRDV